MAATATPCPEETTLHLRRTFRAPREKVFRAWTEPEELKRWWLPSNGYAVPAADVDLRPGGRYRIAMRNPKGEVHYLAGTYREVRPPERLVYTWQWESAEPAAPETLVTVEFFDRGGATEVAITHERFADRHRRDRHVEGWSGCLDHLAEALA